MNTILLVDDSPTIRKMVRTSLASLRETSFTEASSGLEAIETLSVMPVQLVVLDLNMPDMHGLEVLRFVRSHDHYKHLPVIVLTTRGDTASRQAVLQAGASAFLTKPFEPAALAATVHDALGGSRPHWPSDLSDR
jgi:two-component system chemotaxis response regulator CheY